MDFKTSIVKDLYERTLKPITDLRTVARDPKAIKLSDIFKNFGEPVGAIIEDINDNGIKVIIDSEALSIYQNTTDGSNEKQNMIMLLESIGNNEKGLSVDISSLKELSYEQYKDLKSHCKISRVHLNNGWDEAAKIGMSDSDFNLVAKKASEMMQAIGLTDSMSAQEKFDKIYDFVIKSTTFDYNEGHLNTSRDLYGFFVRQNAVCAGGTLGIINLLEMAGFECEYVQGTGKSPVGGAEYHSWFRVKIDGQWYNCDPTWDITNRKDLNGKYAFKQLSDDDFNRDDMHKVDYLYNPTYIRSNDHTLKSYPEKRQFERAEHSINPTAQSSSKDIYLAKTREEKIAETKSGWVAGLKRIVADTVTFFTGKATSKTRFNEFIRNNASGLTSEERRAFEENAGKYEENKAKSKAAREYYKERIKPNKENKNRIREALAKKDIDLTYTIPEMMTSEQVSAEIERLTAEFTSRGVFLDSAKGIDIDSLSSYDKLRYLRGINERCKIDEDTYKLFDICNACDRIDEIDPRNMDNVVSDEEIEELRIHAEICHQMERFKNDTNSITREQESFIRTLRLWGPTNETVAYMTKIADMIESGTHSKVTENQLRLLKDFVDIAIEASELESYLGNNDEERHSDVIVGKLKGKTRDTNALIKSVTEIERYYKQLDKKVSKVDQKNQRQSEKEQKQAEKAKAREEKQARKEMEREAKQKREEAKRNRGQNAPAQTPPPAPQTPDPHNAFVQNVSQQATTGTQQPQTPQPQTPQQTNPPQSPTQQR